MLGFFKKWLKKEPEAPVEEIELANLHSWFDENTKSSIESLNAGLKEVKQRVCADIVQARDNIKALNDAELLNPDIPERAKHFMQGNRDAYSKRVSSFLGRVNVPDDISGFLVFHSVMQDEIKELTQGTARSFQILQEFFANESKQVLADVGKISKEIDSFRQAFDAAGLDILDSVKMRISDLQAKHALRSALEKDLAERQAELERLSAEVQVLKEDVGLLQKNKELIGLKDKFNEVQSRINASRERILGPFSMLNHALRKFERITYRHRVIVQEYLDSPLDALMKDLHLGILRALHDMELAIMNNRLDLKDKKRDKALEVLKLLTKDYLGSFLTEYGQIKHEQDRIKKQIEGLDAVVLLKEKKEKIQKLENERVHVERKIDLFSKEISKADIKELEDKLVENLRKIANTKVLIKY